MNLKNHKTYYLSMAVYWLVFGLITTFMPQVMDLFQTTQGVGAKTEFSNHVWFHGGLDIIAFCILILALSRLPPSRTMLRAAAVAALLPAVAILYSTFATPYWTLLFLVAGLGCIAFSVWGFLLARHSNIPS